MPQYRDEFSTIMESAIMVKYLDACQEKYSSLVQDADIGKVIRYSFCVMSPRLIKNILMFLMTVTLRSLHGCKKVRGGDGSKKRLACSNFSSCSSPCKKKNLMKALISTITISTTLAVLAVQWMLAARKIIRASIDSR
jgi:hypothetical protein